MMSRLITQAMFRFLSQLFVVRMFFLLGETSRGARSLGEKVCRLEHVMFTDVNSFLMKQSWKVVLRFFPAFANAANPQAFISSRQHNKQR